MSARVIHLQDYRQSRIQRYLEITNEVNEYYGYLDTKYGPMVAEQYIINTPDYIEAVLEMMTADEHARLEELFRRRAAYNGRWTEHELSIYTLTGEV